MRWELARVLRFGGYVRNRHVRHLLGQLPVRKKWGGSRKGLDELPEHSARQTLNEGKLVQAFRESCSQRIPESPRVRGLLVPDTLTH